MRMKHLNLSVSVALCACIFTKKSVTIQSKSEAKQRIKDDEPPPPSLLRRPHALRRHCHYYYDCDRGQLLRSCRRRRLRQSTLGSQHAHHEMTRWTYSAQAIDHPHPHSSSRRAHITPRQTLTSSRESWVSRQTPDLPSNHHEIPQKQTRLFFGMLVNSSFLSTKVRHKCQTTSCNGGKVAAKTNLCFHIPFVLPDKTKTTTKV